MRTAALLLLTMIVAVPAEAGLRARCRRAEAHEPIALCRAAGHKRAACRQALVACCVAHGGTLCVFEPPTTTTTTTLPPSNCPAGYPVDCGNGYCCPANLPVCLPDAQCGVTNPFAAFDGTWTYSLSYVGSVGCTTRWPSGIVCTLALTTDTQGGITGVDCAGHTFTGAFTSATTASIQSSAFADPYGCTSAFAADLSGMTPNNGAVNVGVAQQCTSGVVCTDDYTGTLTR